MDIPKEVVTEMIIAVANGAIYLDEKFPGWENKIDLGSLKMNNGEQCILGQVGKDIVRQVSNTLLPTTNGWETIIKNDPETFGPWDDDDVSADFGFNVHSDWSDALALAEDDPDDYDFDNRALWSRLGEIWIAFIDDRRLAGYGYAYGSV